MSSLARKLARLETIVSAKAEESSPTFWTEARIEGYRAWAERLLDTMPYERARAAFNELITLPAERWGSVTRRLDHLARMGASGAFDSDGWPYWVHRAIALPEAVCAALERHPDAAFLFDHSCEDCGLDVPHQPYAGPALLAACPLCGGEVKHCGYTHKRLREVWERQKAERAAG